jgi:hypothetical protein
MTAAIPQVGEQVYLGSTNALAHWYGIITDGEVPGSVTATMEWGGDQAVISLAALVGPRGPAGANAPIVKMQYGTGITDPADLPGNLLNIEADLGKSFWIGNNVYVWSGLGFEKHQMGTAGPPGPIPALTFGVQLVDPETEETKVIQSGTDLAPSIMLNLAVPEGPPGPAGPIRAAADYDNSVAPAFGDAIVWNGHKYAPSAPISMTPRMYSVPESAFTNATGLSNKIPIGAFSVPPQPFDWVPWVFGHVRALGADLSTDPFQIGCEALLGDPTSGLLISRGFGTIANWAIMQPHFSSPSNAAQAVTPENGYAVVPANHTGTQGNVYVNLANDGIAGIYTFNKSNAQLTVMCMPVAPSGSGGGGGGVPGAAITVIDGGSL